MRQSMVGKEADFSPFKRLFRRRAPQRRLAALAAPLATPFACVFRAAFLNSDVIPYLIQFDLLFAHPCCIRFGHCGRSKDRGLDHEMPRLTEAAINEANGLPGAKIGKQSGSPPPRSAPRHRVTRAKNPLCGTRHVSAARRAIRMPFNQLFAVQPLNRRGVSVGSYLANPQRR